MARIKKQKFLSMTLMAIIILVIISIVLIVGIGSKPYCGNGKCENEETCVSCSQDCGSCPITTTTIKITTTLTPKTTTTISKCYNNSDCMWCNENCIPKPNDIPCIAMAPPEGYSCECVNGLCAKVQASTTTLKISDGCNDTDGGLNYYVQGTVSGYYLGKPFSHTDLCTNDVLTEYYCLTYYGKRQYNCAYAGKKCVDGACV